MAKADEDYNCNAYLCRGYQFEDNTDNVLEVSVGEVLYFHVDLIAGHHPGYAVELSHPDCYSVEGGDGQGHLTDCVQNVSIVDTSTNEVIGELLRSWDDWPNHLSGPPRDDSMRSPHYSLFTLFFAGG
jgi:hypothetical protein